MFRLTEDISKVSLPAELSFRHSLLTVGVFDGIHRGHQYLIGQLVAQARQQGGLAGLVTFDPHPAEILSPQHIPLYLTSPQEKISLLETLGLDWTAILPFRHELAEMPPRTFVEHLYRRLNMRSLFASSDFALGRGRAGDIAVLQDMGQEMGFQVHIVAAVNHGDEIHRSDQVHHIKISSSRIRALLQDGQVKAAAGLLGRHYQLAGQVIYGARRGRLMGFPTANVAVPANRVIPANGVYATMAHLGEKQYLSVTNVGTRPSFDDGARSIETFLLDFSQDIYGYTLALDFVARIRTEQRFANVQDLIAQIEQDVNESRRILQARGFVSLDSCSNHKDTH